MFKVTGPRLLVRRIKTADKTDAGIHIPDQAKEKGSKGVIVRVGDGPVTECCGMPLGSQFNEGDHIMFGKYAGTELVVDGEEHLIIGEEDVLGVFTDDVIDAVFEGGE